MDTASEALAVSIAEKARVDMEYMEQLTGKTSDELAAELRGVIFRVPGQTEPDGTPHYVTADEYLSGNVRRKLRQAQRAAERDPAFAINVDALTAAQPKDLDASEIEVRLGATWIDKAYIQQFMYETFDTPFYLQRNIEVNYSSFTAEWQITGKSSVSQNNVAAYTLSLIHISPMWPESWRVSIGTSISRTSATSLTVRSWRSTMISTSKSNSSLPPPSASPTP